MAGLLGASGSFAWRSFWRSPRVLLPLALALLVNLGTWFLLWLKIKPASGFSTVRYSIYIGANWVAPWYFVFVLPLTALGLVVLDTLLAYLLGKYSLSVRYLMLWAGVSVSLCVGWLALLLIVFNG